MRGEPNYGYDDARGDYLTVVGDHIGYRYEVQDVLGRGSFGQVRMGSASWVCLYKLGRGGGGMPNAHHAVAGELVQLVGAAICAWQQVRCTL